jgi:anhydro-N-acetylmuramic acid kinase
MEKLNTKNLVLGIMSGTSLDGLDLALCEFDRISDTTTFKILGAKTSHYSPLWKKRLSDITIASAEDYFKLHAVYGQFIAEEANQFLKALKIQPDLIASHGHTVFHQPALGFSTQIGCGATIAANTGITTVCDFRSLDVALHGQGAPLVPIGDKLLFGKHTACLNIGGIANISFDDAQGKRVAYDVCEANMLLNYLAEKAGKEYDKGGEMARKGKVDEILLHQFNCLEHYTHAGAKSIGREWFEEHVLKLVHESKSSNPDLLTTATEHIATIISRELNLKHIKSCLVSGGGAFNSFLISKVRAKTPCEIIVPEDELVNFKEALIFAFLGYLRVNAIPNTLATVTGAKHNSIGGAVYLV